MKEARNSVHDHSHSENRFAVISTPQRLQIEMQRAGKNVTIAFVDSGFYPHPDLVNPVNRIIAYHDVTNPKARLMSATAPEAWAWHGTQTAVSAAGNGYLSDGIYRGLASEANVVLVKVSERGKITEENIVRGLRWVIANKERFHIGIVSISLGGDEDVPYEQNTVDRLAEEAMANGIVIVVAAGNSGCTNRHHTVPPANAPSVITVGGYDDGNRLSAEDLKLYCSSFGATADGFLKPEIIAPAMWIAAPILPETDLYAKAEALSQLLNAPDYRIGMLLQKVWIVAGLSSTMLTASADVIRTSVESAIRNNKIISAHYQHVDGTSFAAPIVASLVALMLETNPGLTPAAVKNILISTAERIGNAPVLRQGYGVINARAALEQASRERHFSGDGYFLPPRVQENQLLFSFHHDTAETVSLAGDWNAWNAESDRLKKSDSGIWQIAVPLPAAGRYRYKFVVNGEQWMDDPSNGMKEPDGYGGFNSILKVL